MSKKSIMTATSSELASIGEEGFAQAKKEAEVAGIKPEYAGESRIPLIHKEAKLKSVGEIRGRAKTLRNKTISRRDAATGKFISRRSRNSAKQKSKSA